MSVALARPVKVVEVLDNIPFKLSFSRIMLRMRFHGESNRFESIARKLVRTVLAIARPKAV